MTASPTLDGRTDFTGTLTALQASMPANSVPNGTLAITTDYGLVVSKLSTNSWVASSPLATGGGSSSALSRQVPTTGFSIQIAAGVYTLILNPAGTLATGTVVFPQSPVDNQNLIIASSQAVTSLTCTPGSGQTIKNAPTALTAGVAVELRYVLVDLAWYRII